MGLQTFLRCFGNSGYGHTVSAGQRQAASLLLKFLRWCTPVQTNIWHTSNASSLVGYLAADRAAMHKCVAWRVYRGSRISRKSSGTAEIISTSFGARAREYLAHASRRIKARFTSWPSFTPVTSWSTISVMARTRACRPAGMSVIRCKRVLMRFCECSAS